MLLLFCMCADIPKLHSPARGKDAVVSRGFHISKLLYGLESFLISDAL